MTRDKAHIEDLITRSQHKSTPVLLKFQNGDLRNTHKDATLYFQAKHESDKTKKHAIVVTSGNVYAGPVSNGSQDLVDTYICVRNKETNKVRIMPIDQVKLINSVYEEKEKAQFALLSKEAGYGKAIQNFGGRRDMRSLNQRERNKVNIDVFVDQLETTVENSAAVTETPEEVVSTEDIIDRIRPKFNKDATALSMVFNVYDVIPLELMDRLDEEVSVIFNTDIDDIPISSDYLKNAIIALRKGPQSSQTLVKMKIILYMDGLMALIKTRVKNLAKLELSKITEKVENDIRERFSCENSFQKRRTYTSGEKALCYFLVLAFLLSDDYEVSLVTLATELSLPKTKIVKYGNLVNAFHKPKSNSLVLRLPSTIKPQSFAFVGKNKRQRK
ncbi:uncharacterized protein LOC129916263 [Episyrphus balteatus]|uniref:uncharacterized protein LOC129916263 n=1 Tax=Episyrphus balteatus TaxID=286459 RepID=UPI0024863BD1|nr:uncharacterized protein LOC129916263 [Episyrphus balteatus]